MKFIATYSLTSRRHSVTTFSICLGLASIVVSSMACAQSVIAPPTIGQETKGTPAVAEVTTPGTADSNKTPSDAIETEASKNKRAKGIDNLLGNATITESKRDSGQRYLIELNILLALSNILKRPTLTGSWNQLQTI